MNIFEGVKTMLAVRDYRREKIPTETVTRILEAARLTGSSRNRQHWDFVVVEDPQILKQLGALASTGPYIANAPLAIAVIVPDSPSGYVDGARATQDMMLVAWEEGIGSNWVGNVNTDAIKQLLNIPTGRMILNVIPFGYPAKTLGQGKKNRKPLHEIAHAGKFGQPYQ
jgi:nitroreductase